MNLVSPFLIRSKQESSWLPKNDAWPTSQNTKDTIKNDPLCSACINLVNSEILNSQFDSNGCFYVYRRAFCVSSQWRSRESFDAKPYRDIDKCGGDENVAGSSRDCISRVRLKLVLNPPRRSKSATTVQLGMIPSVSEYAKSYFRWYYESLGSNEWKVNTWGRIEGIITFDWATYSVFLRRAILILSQKRRVKLC